MGKTITLELTLLEVQVLRRLIVEEARRLGHPYQRPGDEPPKLRRMRSVSRKIWEARRHFDGAR